ncbi:MAG: hypothetical protein PVF46_02510 [Lysobacterales bacterium]|jgi:hypothetical protein
MKRKFTLCLIIPGLLALASCRADTPGQDSVALKAYAAAQARFEASATPGLAVAAGMRGKVGTELSRVFPPRFDGEAGHGDAT